MQTDRETMQTQERQDDHEDNQEPKRSSTVSAASLRSAVPDSRRTTEMKKTIELIYKDKQYRITNERLIATLQAHYRLYEHKVINNLWVAGKVKYEFMLINLFSLVTPETNKVKTYENKLYIREGSRLLFNVDQDSLDYYIRNSIVFSPEFFLYSYKTDTLDPVTIKQINLMLALLNPPRKIKEITNETELSIFQ